MDNLIRNNNAALVKSYLYSMLSGQLSYEAFAWLKDCIKEPEEKIYESFSKVPAVTGRHKINFNEASLKEAARIRKGWSPAGWNADHVARIFLVLSLQSVDEEKHKKEFKNFFKVADVGELTALYLGLPLYPFPENHITLAIEGVRSNMKAVFEAVALDNPYPADYFPPQAWNQMVLKAAFLDCSLYKIYGLEGRANSRLAYMLCDYARERQAAGRTVSPELWRPVGPFIDKKIFDEVEKVFHSGDQLQREAAALACAMSQFSHAHRLLDSDAELKSEIINRQITWQSVAEKWHEEKETVYQK
jgi:hypothetical protein